jgi:hypothetical protein
MLRATILSNALLFLLCCTPQRATFCYAHRLKDMINVKRPICEDCGQRIYGGGFKMKGDQRVRWCVQCKVKHAGAVPGRPIRNNTNQAAR